MQWPTPNAQDGERGAESRETKQARGAGGINLNQAAKQDWFTPQGRDWKDTGPTQGNRKDVNLGVQVHQTSPAGPPDPASRSTSGKSRDWQTPGDRQTSPPMTIGSTTSCPAEEQSPSSPNTNDGRLWSTPNAMDGGSVSRGGERVKELLLAGQAGASRSKGSLNPRWVLQLQGYPADWLDIDGTA